MVAGHCSRTRWWQRLPQASGISEVLTSPSFADEEMGVELVKAFMAMARIRVCISLTDPTVVQGWGMYAEVRRVAGKGLLGGETQLGLKQKQELRGQGRGRDGKFR